MLYLVRLAAKPLRVRVTGGGDASACARNTPLMDLHLKFFLTKRA